MDCIFADIDSECDSMNTKPGPTLYDVSRTCCIESSYDLVMPHELINIVIEMTNIEVNIQMYM